MEDGTIGTGQQSTLNTLLFWRQFSSTESWGVLDIITHIPDYLMAVWKAAIWDFAFLEGGWIYVKWVIWAPLMAMFVWGIILTFISLFQKVLT